MYLNINDIYMSLFGGTLISLSTTFHLLFKGRITGFSGIVSSIVNFDKSSMFWKIGLMSSVICSSCILYLLYHDKPIIQGANPPFD